MTARINVQDVLSDIRNGLDDDALMKKYRLSEKGLQNLHDKLVSLGIVKQLNAFVILRDIRKGLDDAALMRKYGLTPRGLGSVFRKLVETGFLESSQLENRGRG